MSTLQPIAPAILAIADIPQERGMSQQLHAFKKLPKIDIGESAASRMREADVHNMQLSSERAGRTHFNHTCNLSTLNSFN